MKTNIIFLLFIITIVSCKSSYTKIGDENANYIPYYLKVYDADSLYYANDFKSYKKILKEIFKNYEPINIPFYWEYEKYVASSIILNKSGNYDKELEQLIEYYGYSLQKIKNDSILSIALNNSTFDKIYLNKLEQKYKDGLDLQLIEVLKNIEDSDQEIRKRDGLNWEERELLMKEIDKKNDSILRNYIMSNGYPRTKKINGFSLSLLLNHFSYGDSYKFYKEILPRFIKDGTCNPIDYSSMIDRWYLINTGTPFYYMRWNNKLKKIENDTVTINKINLERKKIGLPSIEQDKVLLNRINKNY